MHDKNLKNDQKREKHQNYTFEMFNITPINLKEVKKHVKTWSETFKNAQKWSKMTKNDPFFMFFQLSISQKWSAPLGVTKNGIFCVFRKKHKFSGRTTPFLTL